MVGGALIVPQGLIDKLVGQATLDPGVFGKDREQVEKAAMKAVMDAERALGFSPTDVSRDNRGYDIESAVLDDGRLRFIEVKGRARGVDTVTVSRNEILCAFNKPDDFILAVVQVDGNDTEVTYLRRPFDTEPEFSVTSINYNLKRLIDKGLTPEEDSRQLLAN